MKTVKLVGEKKNRPVLRLPFAEIPGAFIIMSFKCRQIDAAHLDFYVKYADDYRFADEAYVSFFYGGEKVGCEWEPKYGPLMTYTKCNPDWKGTSCFDRQIAAKEHWFYDYVEDEALAWSQLAVNENRLKEKLHAGDFAGIFAVLKRRSDIYSTEPHEPGVPA